MEGDEWSPLGLVLRALIPRTLGRWPPGRPGAVRPATCMQRACRGPCEHLPLLPEQPPSSFRTFSEMADFSKT